MRHGTAQARTGVPLPWPLFVINLDRAAERRAIISQMLLDTGLAFTRWPAIDGAAHAAEWRSGPSSIVTKRAMSAAEIGCAASHITLWRHIAGLDVPAAIVLEDDAVLAPRAPSLFAELAREAPDWDILKFSGYGRSELLRPRPLGPANSLGVPAVIPASLAGYAITPQAAAHLAPTAVPIGEPVDMFVKRWWGHGGCVKLVEPHLVVQRHLPSDIGPAREAAKGSPAQRLWRNLAYQVDFRWNLWTRAGQRPMSRRWPAGPPP